jgi:hypothetical protein
MNINEPANSRMLAILIQPVVSEDRSKFIRGAEEAEDMDSFIETLDNYKTELE